MSTLKVGQTVSYLKKKCRDLNVELMLVPNDVLTLDLDNGAPIKKAAMEVLENQSLVLRTLTTISRSGNRHVYIQLAKEFGTVERIAMQAALGSDPAREMLSTLDPECEAPIVLFETKEEIEKVRQWLKLSGPSDDEDLFA
jgi:hypothetical protein